jgi:hypothetical protein
MMMALQHSTNCEFIWHPVSNPGEIQAGVNAHNPDAVIYNYHPSPLGYAAYVTPSLSHRTKQFCIIHEQVIPPLPAMDALITLDPNRAEDGQLFSPGWFIIDYENRHPLSDKPTFGSFGFGFPGKGFERMVETVQNEFDEAHIRLGLAYAFYGDHAGSQARATADRCRALIRKPGVTIEISHDLLEIPDLVDWLGKNSVNVFLYDFFGDRGLSSVPIYALSSRRPLAMTKSFMFRHVYGYNDSAIFVEDSSLKNILEAGMNPLKPFYETLTPKRFIENYERMLEQVCSR